MNTSNQISHHHGTCNMCNAKNIVIVMFGYSNQDKNYFCICKNCFAKYIQQIIYGFHNYNDGLID
jgi:transcription elongation factor Elf1